MKDLMVVRSQSKAQHSLEQQEPQGTVPCSLCLESGQVQVAKGQVL